jgi:hypothetical protein
MKTDYITRQVSIRLNDDEWMMFKEMYRDRCLELEQYISKTQFVKERIFESQIA